MKVMALTVLSPYEWPSVIEVVGVLSSHDQDVVDPLPREAALDFRYPDAERRTFALEARALHQTSEHRQIVAVPVDQREDGHWVRVEGRHSVGRSLVETPLDSRQRSFLSDLSGYAYDPVIALHDRPED